MSNCFSEALAALFLLGVVLPVAFSQGAVPNCSLPLTSSNGQYTYNIQGLIGVMVNASVSNTDYKISLCANDIPRCGLCETKVGYCEVEQWYENCVGKFSGATASDFGTGVTLYYPNGEFGRNGTVQLLCDPNAGSIGVVRIKDVGSYAIINSSLACPVNSTPPSCDQFGADCKACLSTKQPCAFCLDSNSCIGGNQTCGDYIKKPELCSKVNSCRLAPTCGNCINLNNQFGCYWCPSLVGNSGRCEQSSAPCSTGKITKGKFCNVN